MINLKFQGRKIFQKRFLIISESFVQSSLSKSKVCIGEQISQETLNLFPVT